MNGYKLKERDFAFGNFFHLNVGGDHLVVESHFVDFKAKTGLFLIDNQQLNLNLGSISPIKITPDRLLKSKFKPDFRNNGCFEKAGIHLIPRKKTESWHVSGVRGANIKFFHELQNLHFALNHRDIKIII